MKSQDVRDQNSSNLQQDDVISLLRESEKGKNVLLSLSNEIAHIQDRQELLHVLQQHLKEIGLSMGIVIEVIKEDHTALRNFLPSLANTKHAMFNILAIDEEINRYPDKFLELAAAAKEPLLIQWKDLAKQKETPAYLKWFKDYGIGEMICMALKDRNRMIGGLLLFSKNENRYSNHQLALLQGIANQVGTAVAKILTNENSKNVEREKGVLLSISEAMTRIKTKEDLLALINGALKDLLLFHHAGIGVINRHSETYNAFLFDPSSGIPNIPELESYFKEGHSRNNIVDVVLNSDQPVAFDLDEIIATSEAPLYTRLNYAAGMKEMVLVALRNEGKNIGLFGIFSDRKNKWTKNHLDLLQAVAGQLSIAVANIRVNEELLERENEKLMLLSLSGDITSCCTYKDIQDIVTTRIEKYFQFNEVMICLNNPDNLTHRCYIHTITQETMKHGDFVRAATMNFFINDGIFNVIEESTEPVIFDMDELVSRKNKPFYVDCFYELSVKEIIGFPLRMNNESFGIATLYPKKKNMFDEAGLKLAQALCSYIGIALSNIRSYEKIQTQLEEIDQYKSQLERENRYLQEQIQTNQNFEEVIGASNGLHKVFQLVSNVAPTDSTVLIEGETGTGKELIATAIHNSSPRKGQLLVKLNCAALPSHLVESELFGHEKGSFTGAIERRIGKFELAHKGTLFLDEIGEMSLALQAKLLRALQEKEIERIGGNSVIKTDVRVIAASNRNLKNEVDAGRFRSDLYFRLNVFPIYLPPLRDRMEDIPMLVSYFIKKFCQKAGQSEKNMSARVVKEMMMYDWPGNVRELEHFIERSLLTTPGNTITEIQLLQHDQTGGKLPGEVFKSFEENERDHILQALKRCKGKIRGEGGAAEILKVPPTTLHSKMKKLGIRKTGK